MDKRLMKMAQVSNLKISHEINEDKVNIVVKFDDSNAMRNIFYKMSGLNCMYIVEIQPSIESVRFFLIVYDRYPFFTNRLIPINRRKTRLIGAD